MIFLINFNRKKNIYTSNYYLNYFFKKENSANRSIILAALLQVTTIFLNITSSIAQCHIDDWTALKALYENTNGDSWIDNTGWEIVKPETPTELCNLADLFGIYVNESGRVECIDLDGREDCVYELGPLGNNLTGIIPIEIGNISNLKTLNLENNQLSSSIPIEFGRLKNLRELFLSDNLLNGNIPAELGDLDSLGYILLGDNQLTDSIPAELGKLHNLQYLHLNNNNLTGCIPASFGDLTNLSGLTLQFNDLECEIPPEIGKLNKLTYFVANSNQLSGPIPPEIGELQNLSNLNLNYNQLSGSLPIEITNLDALQYLILHSNELSGEIPLGLGNLSMLQELRLDFNQFSGSIPATLGNLQNLTELDLRNNELSDVIPSALGNLTSLTKLYLGSNNLNGCYPDSIYQLCSQLDKTGDSNSYGNNFLASWDDFCATKAGICSENKCHINDWTALKALYENTNGNNWNINEGWDRIIQNNINAPDVCDLSELWGVQLNTFGRVSSIDLDGEADFVESETTIGNNLVGSIPLKINQLDSLICLNLNHNILSGNFPLGITGLNNLEKLSLKGIGLENEIPTEIALLENLNHLNLSKNQLTGEIPYEIGILSNLKKLQLNNNLLNGSITESLGYLYQLELLEIANNNLTGCYPLFIKNYCTENYNGQALISDGNNFESDWEAFCNMEAGVCEPTRQCDKEVWYALKALYKNTNGENWTINTGWNAMFENNAEPPTYCDFNVLHGVNLYSGIFNEAHIDILLSNNQLNGNIPSEIIALNNLFQLDLSNNQLTGCIPGKPDTSDSYLYYLKLSNNLLTDSIPANISNHKNLGVIDLSYNELAGHIPIQIDGLINLYSLRLDGNLLSGN